MKYGGSSPKAVPTPQLIASARTLAIMENILTDEGSLTSGQIILQLLLHIIPSIVEASNLLRYKIMDAVESAYMQSGKKTEKSAFVNLQHILILHFIVNLS